MHSSIFCARMGFAVVQRGGPPGRGVGLPGGTDVQLRTQRGAPPGPLLRQVVSRRRPILRVPPRQKSGHEGVPCGGHRSGCE